MHWSDVTLLIAYGKANNDLLTYALENGCPNTMGIPARRSARLMERRHRGHAVGRLEPNRSLIRRVMFLETEEAIVRGPGEA